ncbi:multicopper oxidase family protein [Actinomadura fibrosa]|uniref:Multicopper oxidase CueO n=1 Tax=Actinomadura fibrosa TaxID=111802 RepID=A0ABW2XW07_9ACTN|nr:multicopper oxidase family protein [Actinomadura fibrosa]
MSGRPSRRRFLGVLGGAAGAGAVGAAVPWLASSGELGLQMRSARPLPEPFRVPLPVPPVAVPRRTATTDHYELTQRPAAHEILPGASTEIWGYEGIFPGPTIVSRSGRTTVVRHHNRLPVPTVVHLHGGHTPASSDGYPTDLVLPDAWATAMPMDPTHPMHAPDPAAVVTHGVRDYVYPLRQRAATLWYHDHRMGFTGSSVWRGLAGFHLVHDDEEDALPLPKGDRDIPLMITDRAFTADGAFRYPALDPSGLHEPGVRGGYHQGVLGDVVLVNGAPWPVLDVDAARYRFRFLNASNARRYRLALDPAPPGGSGLVQIGSDGGLLAAPRRHDSIGLAPAERCEVVVDFSRYRVGEPVTLRNLLGRGPAHDVMRFRVVRRARDDSRVPGRLSSIEPLVASGGTVRRTFVYRRTGDAWTINGHRFAPARVDTDPRLGDVEVWRFISDFQHPVHLHLGHFQVLGRDRGGPGPYDAGWKDTIDLRPAQAAAVIVRFDDYRGRFLHHCHNLEHEDMAMMANFQVV